MKSITVIIVFLSVPFFIKSADKQLNRTEGSLPVAQPYQPSAPFYTPSDPLPIAKPRKKRTAQASTPNNAITLTYYPPFAKEKSDNESYTLSPLSDVGNNDVGNNYDQLAEETPEYQFINSQTIDQLLKRINQTIATVETDFMKLINNIKETVKDLSLTYQILQKDNTLSCSPRSPRIYEKLLPQKIQEKRMLHRSIQEHSKRDTEIKKSLIPLILLLDNLITECESIEQSLKKTTAATKKQHNKIKHKLSASPEEQ